MKPPRPARRFSYAALFNLEPSTTTLARSSCPLLSAPAPAPAPATLRLLVVVARLARPRPASPHRPAARPIASRRCRASPHHHAPRFWLRAAGCVSCRRELEQARLPAIAHSTAHHRRITLYQPLSLIARATAGSLFQPLPGCSSRNTAPPSPAAT